VLQSTTLKPGSSRISDSLHMSYSYSAVISNLKHLRSAKLAVVAVRAVEFAKHESHFDRKDPQSSLRRIRTRPLLRGTIVTVGGSCLYSSRSCAISSTDASGRHFRLKQNRLQYVGMLAVCLSNTCFSPGICMPFECVVHLCAAEMWNIAGSPI
jgi:hypothetical protein